MNRINIIVLFFEIASTLNDYIFLLDNANNSFIDSLNLTKNLNTLLRGVRLYIPNSPCIDSIEKYYQDKLSEIEKIYEGSSKGFVDMNSFSTCINNNSNTFFSIYPNYSKTALEDIARLNDNLEEHLWIFGVCLRKDICSSDDIKEIFDVLNQKFFRNQIFKLYNKSNIIVDDYLKTKDNFADISHSYRKIICIIPIIIQIIFIIFKIIPVKLFICCLRRKYIRETDKDKNKGNNKIDNLINSEPLNRQITLKIRKCFSISEIVDDFIFSNKSELFKDEDMTYLKGIKTLGVFLFILGFNFTVLYNYPLCLGEKDKRESYLKNFGSKLLTICFRLSPALILSSSGYSLSYKFLNFLDKKLTNITLDKIEQKNNNNINNTQSKGGNSNNNNDIISEKTDNNDISSKGSSVGTEYYEDDFGIKFYNKDISKQELNKIFKGQKINEKLLLNKISTDKIPCYIYFNFALRQIHKFVLMILGFEIYKHFLPYSLALYVKAPLIIYIYKNLFLQLGNSALNFLFVGDFIVLFIDSDDLLMMQLFCIPMSEYTYFIICSIIIFICYKKKWRLDIIICIMFFVTLALKIVYITYNFQERNPGMFYTNTAYQKFFFNPLFNFDFYLIGMLFGILNYVIQNGLTNINSITKERPFITFPSYLMKHTDYNKNKKFIHFIIIVIIMLFSLIIFPILFSTNLEDIIEKNNPNIFFIIISLIDVELFIFCFHFVLISSYISGGNVFFKLFNAHISSYGMKLSFWIILMVPTCTYISVYGNESNINLSFFMVLIYSAITLINSAFLAFIFFLIFEIPYKKLIKLYFNISSEINKVYLEEADENNTMNMNELNEKDIEGDNNNEKIENKEEEDEDDDDIKD